MRETKVESHASDQEIALRERFYTLFKECPIPPHELMKNLGLFLNRQTLARILFMHELYNLIKDIRGVVIEFGVRWGQTLALFESFRGMYEPYNFNRKIIGFDTFAGFPKIHPKDGGSDLASKQNYSVTEGYANYLSAILDYHEQESPMSHVKKYELVIGDAGKTFPDYLKEHPETIIALAYFDLDLYEPTRECLTAMQGHLTRGSVIGFDELNWHSFPGETLAVKEVMGLDKYQIRRSMFSPTASYVVHEPKPQS